MKRALLLTVGTCTVATTLFCGQPVAQDKPVYRYVDAEGRVVYSDRAPGSDARDVQRKRVTANTISTSEPSLVVQQASERFPVTLFTFECGLACDNALALLNRRGVPFETVNVNTAEGQQKLQQVSGDLSAPVLQVGDKLVVKGWNETRWNQTLDQAGYPKSPARRSSQGQRPLNEPIEAQPAPQVARTAGTPPTLK
ncbi:MAG TPA: glutaredoxin family protein [Casimicrobiaceae bacterium]|nr:glutaredoxin family protein [Casimicrobiaceae bacterium]